jgi:hypothetical protein
VRLREIDSLAARKKLKVKHITENLGRRRNSTLGWFEIGNRGIQRGAIAEEKSGQKRLGSGETSPLKAYFEMANAKLDADDSGWKIRLL